MTIEGILKSARTLIADPKNWCTGSMASKGNQTVDPFTPGAQRCAIGAVWRIVGSGQNVTRRWQHPVYEQAVRELALSISGRTFPNSAGLTPVQWYDAVVTSQNDSGDHKATLEMFDDAIARLEAKAAAEEAAKAIVRKTEVVEPQELALV
jgi:hypothetical protein